MQDSFFVVDEQFNKEKVNKFVRLRVGDRIALFSCSNLTQTPFIYSYETYMVDKTLKAAFLQLNEKTKEVCLGAESIIVKTNSKLNALKKQLERQEKKKNPIGDPETDKVQKKFLEKMKSFFCFCSAKEKKKSSIQKKINNEIKRPKTTVEKQDKSFRTYIKQNCKWVILFLVIYIIILGAVVSTPILVDHLRVRSLNETKQEGSIT